MEGSRPNGTTPTVMVGQVSLRFDTDVNKESRYVIVWSCELRQGTPLVELLISMYVSGHHWATIGVM